MMPPGGGMPMGAPPMGMPAPGGQTPAAMALPILAMLAPQQQQEQAALTDQQKQSMMMMLAQALQGVGNPAGAAAASEPLDPSMADESQSGDASGDSTSGGY